MPQVILTVTQANCRCGYHRQGERFVVGELCPPLCHELWHCAYPLVYALQKSREQHLLLLPKRNTEIPSLAGMTKTVKEFIIPMVTTRPLQDRRSPMA